MEKNRRMISTLGGIAIHVVDPGTEIEGPDGEKLTVTDESAVMTRGAIYCTQTIWEGLNARSRDNSTYLGENDGRDT